MPFYLQTRDLRRRLPPPRREIDAYARTLAGFVRVEKWLSPEGDVVNAIYYFADRESVSQLGRIPQHREAKDQVRRWYDGYRIVVSEISEISASYGGGRLLAPAHHNHDHDHDHDPANDHADEQEQS